MGSLRPARREDGLYVVRMTAEAMPPAKAFWSLTLYDTENGFFMPNERKKYSVGQNAGMKLDSDGGIAIYVAAEQPEGVPAESKRLRLTSAGWWS